MLTYNSFDLVFDFKYLLYLDGANLEKEKYFPLLIPLCFHLRHRGKKERLAGRKINLQRRPSTPKEEEALAAQRTPFSLSLFGKSSALYPPPFPPSPFLLVLVSPSLSESMRQISSLPSLLAVCPCVCPALAWLCSV